MDGMEIMEKETGIDAIVRAEIDIAIATAKRYPRSLKKFQADVLTLATLDQETAESCFYSLPRQGKEILGPSVRLAEIAVSAWGNIRAGARIIGETPDGKFVTSQGVCHDLEKNVLISMDCQRRITTRDGDKFNDDMIGVTANAAAAIGFRNAVFKVIPRALLSPIFEKCMQVATGNAKTLKQTRDKVFAKLAKLNVAITEERILGALGKPSVDDVTTDEVAHLIGLGTAIKEGDTTIDEAFPEIVAPVDTTPSAPPAPDNQRTLLETEFAAPDESPDPPSKPAPLEGWETLPEDEPPEDYDPPAPGDGVRGGFPSIDDVRDAFKFARVKAGAVAKEMGIEVPDGKVMAAKDFPEDRRREAINAAQRIGSAG